MEPPPGFEGLFGGNKVCRLKKTLYGLKQSLRAWFGRFTKAMKELKYKQSQGDHTMFIKHNGKGKIIIDIIITGKDVTERLVLREHLAPEFGIKGLSKLRYFLGIEVTYSKTSIFLSQRKYILDLLKKTGKLNSKVASSPIDPNHRIGSKN